MVRLRHWLFILFLVLLPAVSFAQRELVKKTTDPLCLLPSATSLVLTLVNDDMEGFKQLAFSSATAIATSYALELCIKEKRPDGTGNHAFPSTHTMAAFSGASFLQRRYGWEWGVPAYAIASYVGWGRIYGKRHNIWDVLAGSAIGVVSSSIFTHPYLKGKEISLVPLCGEQIQGVSFAMTF